jgi:hypothetical protein
VGVVDSQDVSGVGTVGAVAVVGLCGFYPGVGGVTVMTGVAVDVATGFTMVPSRYPDTPRKSPAIWINPFHVTQFIPLNLAVSAKMGGALPPVLDMLVIGSWFFSETMMTLLI